MLQRRKVNKTEVAGPQRMEFEIWNSLYFFDSSLPSKISNLAEYKLNE